ncbi:hypothetical protein R3P38DRAFT_3326798 [Favolaschia claudopus]|uniref:Uncharacterized protein n=1 Tax=Favolaschia claudopus TaxID=2862362 RepID=A0AAW0A750_9AGAR
MTVELLQGYPTRSGRPYSGWAQIDVPHFSIVDAVAAAAAVQEQDEDLSQADAAPVPLAAPLHFSATAATPATPATPPVLENLQVPSATPATPATAATATSRDKRRYRERRRQQRAITSASKDAIEDNRPAHIRRHLAGGLKASIQAKFHLMKTRIATTGWIGVPKNSLAQGVHCLGDFVGPTPRYEGFKVVKAHPSGCARPIVDMDSKICGVQGGVPQNDPRFMADVHDPAVAALEQARGQMSAEAGSEYHRRGNFHQLTGGQTHGNGRIEPSTVANGVVNAAIFLALISNVAFIRLAGFATGLFANWAPDVFDFYVDYMSDFYHQYPHLHRPFLNSIWSACTFNLGPRTYTLGHRDFANLAFGWCAITALGNFDYTKGGHLVLWECKLVLEFPPGSTILIPSAALFHSNTLISAGESRYSFTQYTAGGLFRWVERGFKSEMDYFETLTAAEVEEERLLGLERAMAGAGLFSSISDLEAAIVA